MFDLPQLSGACNAARVARRFALPLAAILVFGMAAPRPSAASPVPLSTGSNALDRVLPETVTAASISVAPASVSLRPGGKVSITAVLSGGSGVKWTTDGGVITGTGSTISYSNSSPGIWHVTAASNANSALSSTADVLVLPAGQSYPAVPFPIAAHPRLWITPTDVTRLQGWAVDSNKVYSEGLQPVLKNAISVYKTKFFPGGTANPDWPDPGDSQGYTGYLSEEYAVIFALNSLIDPKPANRILYAQYARNLIMPGLTQAAMGHQPNAPFRDPTFAIYNRASLSGEEWPLVVDWIYDAKDSKGNPILTASDKATVRNVFLIWSADCLNAETTGGDSPEPRGVLNNHSLLPGNQPYRMAANNYYLAHARLLTMMSLAMDPSDDPLVVPTMPATQLGNSLRSYLADATGAWLYQEFAMFSDAAVSTKAYDIANTKGFGLASGGLPPEGMLYGESFGYVLGQLLALQTAGFNNAEYAKFTGPQIGLIDAPVWDRWVHGMITSLIPTSFVPSSETYLGPVYEFASYGDMLRLWVTPDNVNPWTLLNLLEHENGQTTHQADIRWFVENALPGGAAGMSTRINDSGSWSWLESLEYFLLFDPAAAAAADPRPGFPEEFYDPGASRIVAHSKWGAGNTMFDYHASWESINHQDGAAGEFEFYRKGAWLTKEMSNYDNNGVGLTTYYHNTLALQNWCPAGTPSLGWEEVGEWKNGSQFIWGESAGDPVTLTSSGKNYVYAASDLTRLYNRPDIWDASQSAVDITQAQRSIFWLNDDYIVIYDRAASKNAGLFKRFNLSLIANPNISGHTATETMADGQRLFIHTLLPENASITAREAATDLSPIADLEPTKYVMTVEDASNPTTIRFLHVLEGADHGVNATPVSSISSTGGTAFDGAQVGTSVLLFIHNSAQTATFANTVFSESNTVKSNYVAGLKPGAGYKFTKTVIGSTIRVTISSGGTTLADAAGVLVF